MAPKKKRSKTQANKKGERYQHVITARTSAAGRYPIFIAVAFCTMMVLMSLITIFEVPGNPIAHTILFLFIGAIALILLVEENTFPDVRGARILTSVMFLFVGMVFIAFIGSFIVLQDAAHGIIAGIFGIVTILLATYSFAPVDKWTAMKSTARKKTIDKAGARIGKSKKAYASSKKTRLKEKKTKATKKAKAKKAKAPKKHSKYLGF